MPTNDPLGRQSPNQETAGQITVDNAARQAHDKVYGGRNKDTVERAYLIEKGMPVKQAKSIATSSLDAYDVPGYKKGGMVKKTGLALVHKGEKVLTKVQQRTQGKRVRRKK